MQVVKHKKVTIYLIPFHSWFLPQYLQINSELVGSRMIGTAYYCKHFIKTNRTKTFRNSRVMVTSSWMCDLRKYIDRSVGDNWPDLQISLFPASVLNNMWSFGLDIAIDIITWDRHSILSLQIKLTILERLKSS